MSHVDRRAGAVRLSLGSGAEGLAEHGHRTHRNKSPPFLQLRKRRPGTPRTVQGRSARRGNTISDQSVRLRLKINLQKQRHLRIATERKRVRVSSLSPRRHFPAGFSLYDVYERFRHRMVSRLVFPSNKHFEYSQRFDSLRTCYWQHCCSGCDLPPVNTLFQPAIDHPASRRLEAADPDFKLRIVTQRRSIEQVGATPVRERARQRPLFSNPSSTLCHVCDYQDVFRMIGRN